MPIEYEHSLVQRFQRGDHRAMELLFEHHVDSLLRFAMRFVTCREDAEDIVQESFMKAFERAYQFRGTPESFTAWVYAIVRTTSIDRRRQLIFPSMQMSLSDDLLITDAYEPAIHTLMWTAFDQLSEDDQTVLLLCDAESMSHQDTSVVMQRSADAISSQLYRARRRLRDAINRVREVQPWIA